MIDPLKSIIVIRDFQAHIDAGGLNAKYPGYDFLAGIGTPCYAVEDGHIFCGNDHLGGNGGGANYIMLTGQHGSWFYVHLSKFAKWNCNVKEGDLIGYTGDTGNVTGPHLHFGLKVKNIYVDPSTNLPFMIKIMDELGAKIDAVNKNTNARIDNLNEALGNSLNQLKDLTNTISQLQKQETDTNDNVQKIFAMATKQPEVLIGVSPTTNGNNNSNFLSNLNEILKRIFAKTSK